MKNVLLFLSLLFLLCDNQQSKRNVDAFENPIHKIESHPYARTREIKDKIGIMPDALLAQWKRWDHDTSYTSFVPDSNQRIVFEKAISQLPPLNLKAIKERLVGVYFINNFKSSGLTDFVRDSAGVIHFYFVFDSQLFDETIQARINKKENSCFINGETKNVVKIECGKNFPAIVLLLLHESTHAVDMVYQITPFLMPFFSGIKISADTSFSFSKPIWDSYSKPKRGFDFLYRDSITFYGFNNGPKIKPEMAITMLKAFQTSPFSSLYGSMNWAEDLAEMVTYYHLTEKMGVDYKIMFNDENKCQVLYEPMKNEKVRNRLLTISRFYQENPAAPPIVGFGPKKLPNTL